MPRAFQESDGSSKRRSIFSRAPLRALTPIHAENSTSKNDSSTTLLRKRRTSAGGANAYSPVIDKSPLSFDGSRSASPSQSERPSRNPLARPGSLMGSWKSLHRSSDNYDENKLSKASTREEEEYIVQGSGTLPSEVLIHGEVQTSSSMFRKKKEYLVLTDTHLTRFKSQQKAAEAFPSIMAMGSRTSGKHAQSPSVGSSGQDFASGASEHSGDRELGLPLRHVVAVYRLEDTRPNYHAFDISSLDDKSNNASSMTLIFNDSSDMDSWLYVIRDASIKVRAIGSGSMSVESTTMVATMVENDGDYQPPDFAMYKVVQRPASKSSARASTDDVLKVTSTVCFLAIGVHKVHLIPLGRSSQRSSTMLSSAPSSHASYGIMAAIILGISDHDDTFELTFRLPFEKPKKILLASLAAREIAMRLSHLEDYFRPEWGMRPMQMYLPHSFRADVLVQNPCQVDDQSFDRTLSAYCAAYGIDAANVRYRLLDSEDGPMWELLPPPGRRSGQYSDRELLAIMRSLRYNESFGVLSFAGIRLDGLNGVRDPYDDHLCTKTKRGTPIQLEPAQLREACLLVQEIRALAVTNRKLRRMDFTSCIVRKPSEADEERAERDMGCGIVEALFPLCKYNTTNVDWVVLNNIHLGETDMDYLIEAVVLKLCHFRGFGLANTGLTERSLFLILESLKQQENTLQALDLSKNVAHITPALFDRCLSSFTFMHRLNLASLARTPGPDPLISPETFSHWRLTELDLSGVALNPASVDAIATYLHNFKKSMSLRELRLTNTKLNARSIALLMEMMTETPGVGRDLHLDVSQHTIEGGLPELTQAISRGYAPKSLSLRLSEFHDEIAFRRLVLAVAANTTIETLDLSQSSLPSEASEATCDALEKMFAENKTLRWLDISGEDSRLETSKLGVGINRALGGLKNNTALETLRIHHQKLGVQGASTLADIVKANKTLRRLHCDHNEISLSGFTDLVNALNRNTTLIELPAMVEDRRTHVQRTVNEVKQARDEGSSAPAAIKSLSVRSKLSKGVGKVTSSGKERNLGSAANLSDKDIENAIGLVNEGWDRQVYRLQMYLERNNNLAMGKPAMLEIDEEDFERPTTSSGSINKFLEQARSDRTPTMEKEIEFLELDITSVRSKSSPDGNELDSLAGLDLKDQTTYTN